MGGIQHSFGNAPCGDVICVTTLHRLLQLSVSVPSNDKTSDLGCCVLSSANYVVLGQGSLGSCDRLGAMLGL